MRVKDFFTNSEGVQRPKNLKSNETLRRAQGDARMRYAKGDAAAAPFRVTRYCIQRATPHVHSERRAIPTRP